MVIPVKPVSNAVVSKGQRRNGHEFYSLKAGAKVNWTVGGETETLSSVSNKPKISKSHAEFAYIIIHTNT